MYAIRSYYGGPVDAFGDVVGGDGARAFIHLVGGGLVALEADHGELGFAQAGFDVGAPDLGAEQVGAQVRNNFV